MDFEGGTSLAMGSSGDSPRRVCFGRRGSRLLASTLAETEGTDTDNENPGHDYVSERPSNASVSAWCV